MRNKLTILAVLLCLSFTAKAQKINFDTHFADSTLRLDYIFSGNSEKVSIARHNSSVTNGWYGRRVNLNTVPWTGNGQIVVFDEAKGDTLYRQHFSTLFQEWITEEEAQHETKSFENSFLVPMPRKAVSVSVRLYSSRGEIVSQLTHKIDPKDILIRRPNAEMQTPWHYIRRGGDSKGCIDLAFVAEGYTADEMDVFHTDCQRAIDAMLAHEPFKSNADKFNFIAVDLPSRQSGVSIPHNNLWLDTALGSSFDTFYSARYLTTLNLFRVHDALAGIPYEHIVILANTANYGGGGILNSYLLSAMHHPASLPVIVHEFGHSFAGLGDEYFYQNEQNELYPVDVEPWEPNLTTKINFHGKWEDMIGRDNRVGLFEGGGYRTKGVYRPADHCRMRDNNTPDFCPVCQRALQRMIDFHTKQE